MLQAFSESLGFLTESFRTYSDGNLIWLLYPAALLVILLLGRREEKLIFLGALGMEVLTIFNPLFIDLLTRIFSFETRYLRFFWMIPFFLTIAYAMVLLIFFSKDRLSRGIMVLLCTAAILFTATPVFFGAGVPEYEAAENSQFIENEIIELSAILHSEGLKRPKVLYGGLMLVYRQYDPTVISVMGNEAYRKLQSMSYEEYMATNDDKKFTRDIYRVFYYNDYTVKPDRFLKCLKHRKVDYLVSNNENLDTYLAPLKLTQLSRTEHYRVFKIS